MLCCPICGKAATFRKHEHDSAETHGLDCGPYEDFHDEWLTCELCGATTDEDELAAANRPQVATALIEHAEPVWGAYE